MSLHFTKRKVKQLLLTIAMSLTSHVIKVFERVIRKKIVESLAMNDLICGKQHGFRSAQITQLLHHFDDVLESLTENSDFDSIYLDYA